MDVRDFYDRLPRNSIELLGGACLIGGSIAVSKMVLASILQGYGAAYIADLINQSLLEETLIEVYGRKQLAPKPPASYADLVKDLPLARMSTAHEPLYAGSIWRERPGPGHQNW